MNSFFSTITVLALKGYFSRVALTRSRSFQYNHFIVFKFLFFFMAELRTIEKKRHGCHIMNIQSMELQASK